MKDRTGEKIVFSLPSFYDAVYEYEDAEYVIFGVPFDCTSSYRAGSRWAPDEMRKACMNFETYDYYHRSDMTAILVHDAGNMDTPVSADDMLSELYEEVAGLLDDGKFPIMLGGEHSLSYAPVKACRDYYERKDREEGKDPEGITFLVLDAHLDMRTDFRGVKYNHACVSRHIIEEVTPKYVTIGVRSGPEEEWDYMEEHGIPFYTSDDVDERGIREIIKEVSEKIEGDRIYLSLDMDVIDPAYCAGLGTPEPFGLSPREVREVLRAFAPKTIGFDIVEIAPEYDFGNSALLATKLMREFIFAREAGRKKA